MFYQAFADLNETRSVSAETIQRISLGEIAEWCRWYGYEADREFREDMKAHIFALDTMWVSIEQDKRRKANKRGRKGGKTPKLRQEDARFRQGYPPTTERN